MIFILCAIIMLQAGILYRLWQQRRQAELLARNRLRYIEEWLDLLYLYNNDPVSFHTRCKELASVKRLSNYHIVNDSLRLSDCRRHRRSNLTPAEKEFLCLMEAGFSNRALCVIFRVGKVGSIYVKHHRIKAKIVNVNNLSAETEVYVRFYHFRIRHIGFIRRQQPINLHVFRFVTGIDPRNYNVYGTVCWQSVLRISLQ